MKTQAVVIYAGLLLFAVALVSESDCFTPKDEGRILKVCKHFSQDQSSWLALLTAEERQALPAKSPSPHQLTLIIH